MFNRQKPKSTRESQDRFLKNRDHQDVPRSSDEFGSEHGEDAADNNQQSSIERPKKLDHLQSKSNVLTLKHYRSLARDRSEADPRTASHRSLFN